MAKKENKPKKGKVKQSFEIHVSIRRTTAGGGLDTINHFSTDPEEMKEFIDKHGK